MTFVVSHKLVVTAYVDAGFTAVRKYDNEGRSPTWAESQSFISMEV